MDLFLCLLSVSWFHDERAKYPDLSRERLARLTAKSSIVEEYVLKEIAEIQMSVVYHKCNPVVVVLPVQQHSSSSRRKLCTVVLAIHDATIILT